MRKHALSLPGARVA
jgi:hypothetical protein